MAKTATNASMQETFWSAATWYEAETRLITQDFMGTGEDAVIMVMNDLMTNAGATVYFPLVTNLDGAGVSDDNVLIGNEEALLTYAESVTVNQYRHGVRLPGAMESQKVKANYYTIAKKVLSRRLAEQMDELIIRMLGGDTTASFGSAGEACTNVIYGGAAATTASAASTTTAWLGHYEITRLREQAAILDPQIKAVETVGGVDQFALLLHDSQWAKILASDTTISNAYKDATPRSKSGALFTGALTRWMGTNFYVSKYVYAPASGARRALLLGAQAGAFAAAKKPFWREDQGSSHADYGNTPGIACGRIAGFQKVAFNSVDFGVYACDSYAPSTGMAGVAHS